MHNGGGDSFKIGNFCTFQTSMTLTLDWVIWHTVMYHLLTSTYRVHAKFCFNWKNLLWTDRQMDILIGFIRWPKNLKSSKRKTNIQ